LSLDEVQKSHFFEAPVRKILETSGLGLLIDRWGRRLVLISGGGVQCTVFVGWKSASLLSGWVPGERAGGMGMADGTGILRCAQDDGKDKQRQKADPLRGERQDVSCG
jgi:hypothetical protein